MSVGVGKHSAQEILMEGSRWWMEYRIACILNRPTSTRIIDENVAARDVREEKIIYQRSKLGLLFWPVITRSQF